MPIKQNGLKLGESLTSKKEVTTNLVQSNLKVLPRSQVIYHDVSKYEWKCIYLSQLVKTVIHFTKNSKTCLMVIAKNTLAHIEY